MRRLCCMRGGTSFVRSIYATQRQHDGDHGKDDDDRMKFVYIRHERSTGQSFVVQTSNCIDHWVWIFAIEKYPLWKIVWIVNHFQTLKTRTISLWKREILKFVRISRQKQKVECIKINRRKSYFIEFNKNKNKKKSKCLPKWVQVLWLLVLFSPSSASIAANHRHLLLHVLHIPVSGILWNIISHFSVPPKRSSWSSSLSLSLSIAIKVIH